MSEHKVPLHMKLVVGGVAGIIGTTVIFPLDLVKTRLQAQSLSNSGVPRLGGFATFRSVVASEGVRGLYKGLGPNLVGVTPEKAIKLGVNDYLRETFTVMDGGHISLPHEMMAGAGAGLCQVVATTPMELIKLNVQLQGTLPIEQRASTMQIVKRLGIRGCYTGVRITLIRDVPFSILFFPAYANLKLAFANEDGKTGMLGLLTSGAVAGSFAAGLNTPADVIKTRLQAEGGVEKYKNISTCMRIIYKNEGLSAFFKGAVPRMIVQAPLFGIALLSFELQKRYMFGDNA